MHSQDIIEQAYAQYCTLQCVYHTIHTYMYICTITYVCMYIKYIPTHLKVLRFAMSLADRLYVHVHNTTGNWVKYVQYVV